MTTVSQITDAAPGAMLEGREGWGRVCEARCQCPSDDTNLPARGPSPALGIGALATNKPDGRMGIPRGCASVCSRHDVGGEK